MYGLYRSSHYQGSAQRQVAHHPDRALVRSVASELSTCSFCSPGRTAGYSTGTCYFERATRRPRGISLPDDAADWSRTDLLDLLSEQDDAAKLEAPWW